jgi:O-antigen/teichoic acid export membrane protein
MIKKLFSGGIKLHVYNYLFRVLYLLFSFLSIKALLSVLGQERFGIWQVFLVLTEYVALANLGLNNSFRNASAESIAKGNYELLHKTISNVLMLLVVIIAFILPMGLLAVHLIDPRILLKDTSISNIEITSSFQLLFVFSCVNLFLVIGNMLAFSAQRSQLNSFVQFMQILLFYIALQVQTIFGHGGTQLSLVVLFYVGSQLVTSVPLLIYLLKSIHFKFTWNRHFFKDSGTLIRLGLAFFVLQGVNMLLVNFDSLVVSSMISVHSLAAYAIINKIFNVIISLYAISIIPLWSQATHLRANNDVQALTGVTRKYFKGGAFVALIVAVLIVLFRPATQFLFGVTIEASYTLLVIFGLFVLLNYFAAVVINVLNGLSIIRTQLLSIGFSVVIVFAIILAGKLFNFISLELIVTAKVLGSLTLFLTSYRNLSFSFKKLQPAF